MEKKAEERCAFCGCLKQDHRNGRCYHYSDQDTDYFYSDKFYQPKTKVIMEKKAEEILEEKLEILSKESLEIIHQHTTLCVNEEEENIYFQGFWNGYHAGNTILQEAIDRFKKERGEYAMAKAISILESLKTPE